MGAPSLNRASIDRSFYAMLKLHVFANVHGVFLRSFSGRNGHAVQDAKPTLGRFTARKADFLFVPRNGNALKCSADFLGFTSHKVREKLQQLERDGTVVLEGRGLRDAYTYRWTEPLRLHELCSFMVLHKQLPDDLSLSIELARVFDAAGDGPFVFGAFVRAYEEAHGDEYNGSRWGARRFERIRNSSEYERFLKARLHKLVDKGLVAEAPGGFRLTPRAKDLVHHFNLFVDGVPYHPSKAMCVACPLYQNCRVRGLVEPMLGGLSGHLLTFAASVQAEGPSPNGNGTHAAAANGANGANGSHGHAANGANGSHGHAANGAKGHAPAPPAPRGADSPTRAPGP